MELVLTSDGVGDLAGLPRCLVLADVGAEDELEGLGQEAAKLVGFAGDQALAEDPDDPPRQGLLEALRQLRLARVELAAGAQQRRQLLQRRLLLRRRLRTSGDRLDQGRARRGGVSGDVLEEDSEPGADPVGPGTFFTLVGVFDPGHRSLSRSIEKRQEGLFLVGVVLEEGRVADLGPADDLLHRRLLIALLGDHLGSRLEDAATLVGGGGITAHRLGAGGLARSLSGQGSHCPRIAPVPIGTKLVLELEKVPKHKLWCLKWKHRDPYAPFVRGRRSSPTVAPTMASWRRCC